MVIHFDYKHRCLVDKNVPIVLIFPSRGCWESRDRAHLLFMSVVCSKRQLDDWKRILFTKTIFPHQMAVRYSRVEFRYVRGLRLECFVSMFFCSSKTLPIIKLYTEDLSMLTAILLGLGMVLLAYFRSFQTIILQQKNCRLQQYSNSDFRNRRRASWPLDHHHGPGMGLFYLRSN